VFALLPAVMLGWREDVRDFGVAAAGLLRLFGVNVHNAEAAGIEDLSTDWSISIPSAMGRLVGPADAHSVGLALAALVAAASGMMIVTMYRRAAIPLLEWADAAKQHEEPWRMLVLVEWAVLIALTLVFSPQTNARHFFLVLLVNSAAAGLLLHPKASRQARLATGIGMLILWAGVTLPPGGERFSNWLHLWRAVAGPSWCLLAMVLLLLWGALRETHLKEPAENHP
jgi:hypothetical protein